MHMSGHDRTTAETRRSRRPRMSCNKPGDVDPAVPDRNTQGTTPGRRFIRCRRRPTRRVHYLTFHRGGDGEQASVPPRCPTSWSRAAARRVPMPHGIAIAGWPVMLKSCVSRSIIARTGSARPSIVDRLRRRAAARRSAAPAAAARRALRAPCPPTRLSDRARVHRPQVVLRQHVATHLEPQPHAWRVAVGVVVEQRRVIPRRLRQDDVQVDVGGALGVRRSPRRDRLCPRCSQRRARALEKVDDVVRSSLSKKYGTGTPSQSDSTAPVATVRVRRLAVAARVEHSAASATVRAIGPT